MQVDQDSQCGKVKMKSTKLFSKDFPVKGYTLMPAVDLPMEIGSYLKKR